jgi:hypothetical protein
MLRKRKRSRDGRSPRKEGALKTPQWMAAVALLAASALQSGWAQEAGSGASANGPAGTARGGEASPDLNAAAPHGSDARPNGGDSIDSGFAGQASRARRRPSNIGEVRTVVRPGASVSVPARPQTSISRATGERDAVGLPIANRLPSQGANAVVPRQFAPAGQIAAPAAAGSITRNGVGGPTGAGGPAGLHPAPLATGAVVNRATITGTGVTHPGTGPAVLGGPAKTLTGINGTGVRPRH